MSASRSVIVNMLNGARLVERKRPVITLKAMNRQEECDCVTV